MPSISRCVTYLIAVVTVSPAFAATNNIMLTGYWPPTNEAIRPFSANPLQNPDGWIGENWEDRGYNVYSYFPEFDDFPNDRQGTGDFTIDYQDTSEDWWRITSEVNPVAIITFSAGANGLWELEMRQRNLRRNFWQPDYQFPFRPTNNPPDGSVPFEYVRQSSLPMQSIADAVNAADLDSMNAVIDTEGFGGAFLSEFIAYHGAWYHDLHSGPSDLFRNVAAGHIHVGPDIPIADARAATEISLRTLLNHVDSILVPEPTAYTLLMGLLFFFAIRRR